MRRADKAKMHIRVWKFIGMALWLLTAASIPGSALALASPYKQDQTRHPSATKFTPKRFGYMPSQRYLPGTAKVKKKKCIPNGQARCIARPGRPSPLATRVDIQSSAPTRSGSTVAPVVKTFNYDDYVQGMYSE